MAPGAAATGQEMHRLIAELFPLCRSITGDGVRATLRRLQAEVPLSIREVPSGTAVLDWVVPDEWNVREAWIRDSSGATIVDFGDSNLHLVGYSMPVRGRFSLDELRPRLHSLPSRPGWIPYRTTYYERDWGFCLSEEVKGSLAKGSYEVCIDATLDPGSLTYGELRIPGNSTEEVLLSAHVCHPSLANDNLSGLVLAVELGKWAMATRRRYTYRVVLAPGTIGAITWLATHGEDVVNIRHGLVVSGVGDRGPITYKRSRRGDATIDRAAAHVIGQVGDGSRVRAFTPAGYDERQYCSPGFDLPVGCLMRTPHGEYPEYHTSADNLDFVDPVALDDSYQTARRILEVLERDRICLNLSPRGEPQLGRHGLADAVVAGAGPADSRLALLWVLNQSDGRHSLLDIAERSQLPFALVDAAAVVLSERGLLRDLPA